MCMCMWMYVHVYVHVYKLCVCVCVCVFVCMYTYTHVCIFGMNSNTGSPEVQMLSYYSSRDIIALEGLRKSHGETIQREQHCLPRLTPPACQYVCLIRAVVTFRCATRALIAH